jgi:hypothetical protein
LGKAQKCGTGRVKPIDGIPILPLMKTGSPLNSNTDNMVWFMVFNATSTKFQNIFG